MKKIIIKIDGMHCTSCALNIDFDLEDLEGVVSSQTNYAQQKSEVVFDQQKLNTAKILSQIEKTGYKASII